MNTLHDLSVTGPGAIRSTTELQVCKFCHVPHSAKIPVPLWSHALSDSQYRVPSMPGAAGAAAQPPQPSGSSRLCLSCHDGTVALGELSSQAERLPMQGETHLSPGHKGFLGTDLSGGHPVSFKVADRAEQPGAETDSDMGFVPLEIILQDPDITLDSEGRMQCTTCHDPHSDVHYQKGKVPRFWVKPSIDEVCLSCHALR